MGLEISYAWKPSKDALISAIVYNSSLIILFIVTDFNFSLLHGVILKLIFILIPITGVLLGYIALRTFYNRTYIYIDREKIDTFTKPFR
jgi:hypothetical protein